MQIRNVVMLVLATVETVGDVLKAMREGRVVVRDDGSAMTEEEVAAAIAAVTAVMDRVGQAAQDRIIARDAEA